MWFFLALLSSLPILSNFPMGASWLCYYKALRIGNRTEIAWVHKFRLLSLVLGFFLRDIQSTKTIGE